MKKFILGVVSSLGTIGLGKLIYDKGRKDGMKHIKSCFDNMLVGISMIEKDNKES